MLKSNLDDQIALISLFSIKLHLYQTCIAIIQTSNYGYITETIYYKIINLRSILKKKLFVDSSDVFVLKLYFYLYHLITSFYTTLYS